MAKRKINKLYLVGGAGGIVAAVLIAVFVFGIGFDLLPFVSADDVVPTPLTTQEMQENEQILIDINEVTNDPDSFCSVNIDALTQCLSQTRGEVVVDVVPDADPSTFIECGITEETANRCSEQIDQIIRELNAEIIDPPPIPPPDSSPVEPIGQICDLLDLDCGPKPPIKLETIVLKTDSAGFSDTVESTIDVPQLSFFIEDVVNATRDFQTGQLEMIITVIGEPNTLYIASGNLNVIIGTEIVNEIPLTFEISTGTLSGSEGQLFMQFVGPTGIPSPSFLFQFMPNFDKFLNGQTTLLDFVITDLIVDFVDPETGVKFGIVDTSIFSMSIARDDIKLLVLDEQGQTIRVYPSDSRIVLSTVTGRTPSYTTCTTLVQTFSSTFYGNGLGCSQPFLASTQGNGVDCLSSIRSNKGISIPPPTISGISVFDSESNTITTGTSGSGTVLDYNLLTRNQNYTLSVSSLNIVSSDLEYGKTAETKSYQCSQEGTARLTTSRTTSGNCNTACGSCAIYTGIILNAVDPVIEGAISCNIP